MLSNNRRQSITWLLSQQYNHVGVGVGIKLAFHFIEIAHDNYKNTTT